MPKRLVSVGLALVLLMIPLAGLGQQKSVAKKLSNDQKVIHLLDRATFGSRPGDIERVKAMGWEKFIEQQLRPETIPDTLAETKLQGLESITLTNDQIAAQYPQQQVVREALKARGIELPEGQNQPAAGEQDAQMQAQMQMRRQEAQKVLREMGLRPQQQLVQELQQAKILRAVYSERQLQEVMTDFWFNHFNVFANKGADRVLITSYERDAIRPNVFGKFEDLLRATAKSPAMLFYLDNWLSASPNAGNARRPMALGRYERGKIGEMPVQPRMPAPQQQPLPQQQQRRQRGINENYAREIMELHTLGVDGGYAQKDVQEVARCFTGWTIRDPRRGGEFFFNRNFHDDGEKVVLGTKIPSGGGMDDGEMVIKLLAKHASTAKFISTKLARKFVADNPPKSLVDKMAQTFQKTDGNIREVLLVMFKSPEFWAAENFRSKIKTPFEMTVSAVRAVGGETNGGTAVPQVDRTDGRAIISGSTTNRIR